MSFRKLIAAAAFAFFGTTAAQAVTIVSYDIRNADPSGTGGWTNTFDGTITPSADGIPGLVDLIGGGGTLNDGILPTSTTNNQLFLSPFAIGDAAITLYFDRAIRIGTIEFLNNPIFASNSVSGGVRELVAIGGGGDFFASAESEGFGPVGASGFPVNDRFDFSNTSFADIELDSIRLSNFFVDGPNFFNPFSIGEIVVTGAGVAPVPLPASGTLLVAGIGGLVAARRRKKD